MRADFAFEFLAPTAHAHERREMPARRGTDDGEAFRVEAKLARLGAQKPHGGLEVMHIRRKRRGGRESVIHTRHRKALLHERPKRHLVLRSRAPRAAMHVDEQRRGPRRSLGRIQVELERMLTDAGVFE